jgi:hypothetical protein
MTGMMDRCWIFVWLWREYRIAHVITKWYRHVGIVDGRERLVDLSGPLLIHCGDLLRMLSGL